MPKSVWKEQPATNYEVVNKHQETRKHRNAWPETLFNKKVLLNTFDVSTMTYIKQ